MVCRGATHLCHIFQEFHRCKIVTIHRPGIAKLCKSVVPVYNNNNNNNSNNPVALLSIKGYGLSNDCCLHVECYADRG